MKRTKRKKRKLNNGIASGRGENDMESAGESDEDSVEDEPEVEVSTPVKGVSQIEKTIDTVHGSFEAMSIDPSQDSANAAIKPER